MEPEPALEPAREPTPQAVDWEHLRWIRTWFPAAGVVLSILVGFAVDLGPALLVLAATTLLFAISAIWSSLQLVAGDASESAHDVVLLAAPGTEHEQKQSVLRALKDLEFERSVGKISEEDYVELRQRYRAKAREVLQSLDREVDPLRADAERLVASYLKKIGIQPAPVEPRPSTSPATTASDKQEPEAEPELDPQIVDAPASDPNPKSELEPTQDVSPRKCPSCSASNDVDAAFCKKCGERIDKSKSPETGAEP
jgi:hypothetical protein